MKFRKLYRENYKTASLNLERRGGSVLVVNCGRVESRVVIARHCFPEGWGVVFDKPIEDNVFGLPLCQVIAVSDFGGQDQLPRTGWSQITLRKIRSDI